jgi:hypothetical protein
VSALAGAKEVSTSATGYNLSVVNGRVGRYHRLSRTADRVHYQDQRIKKPT